jgi:2-phosphosulfolactate phosphatase
MYYDQQEFDIRCEWGARGLEQLAPSDAVVIIDVLSFSTCVDVAVSCGAEVYPYPFKDETVLDFAEKIGAIAASLERSTTSYSLSPVSFRNIPKGERIVLPSPNGARLSYLGYQTDTFCACLRNYKSIARYLSAHYKSVTVISSGEQWQDASLRPAIEDLLGAGALISELGGSKSPEALMAEQAFTALQSSNSIGGILMFCGSGKELLAKGFPDDVLIAAELNASVAVPMLKDGCYVNVGMTYV